nr:Src homology-3 domain containing protein [Haemonchus contortus]
MVVTGRSSRPAPPPLPAKPVTTDKADGEYTAFSVSAAKAFFEAAKKPEVRQAAVAAAKNPFVRSVAKTAVTDKETRTQLIAALEKQYGAKSPDAKPSPSAKPKHDYVAPPPPPAHRVPTGYSATSSSHSLTSYASASTASTSISDYSKPLPSTLPSTSTYHGSASSNDLGRSPVVVELQELQLNKQGGRNSAPSQTSPPIPPTSRIQDSMRPPRPPPPKSSSGIASAPSSSQPHAIVKYPFKGSQQDELSCVEGDIVMLRRDVDNQWIYGMNNRTGQFGIVPISFLDIQVPLTSRIPPQAVYATALYDYDSNTPGDLTFRAQDQIIATERVGPDWLRGQLHGQEGIFPVNYVSCPGIDGLPMSQPDTQAVPLEKMTAAYDYSSGVAGDLEFKAGDTIEVVTRLDQDWIQGRLNGREGLAPLTFLAPYGTPVKSPKTRGIAAIAALGGTGRTVTAIADHTSDDPNMLYFTKGDRIIIVEDVDSYWYRGKVEGFKTLPAGLFPKALVQED